MTAYAIWDDYVEYLKGREPSVPESGFEHWSRRASAYIDAITFDRLKDPITLELHKEKVIAATCELAEYYSSDVVQESKGLQSVSVTGHSMTFNKSGDTEKETRNIVSLHLANTGLLYRGA